MSGGSWRGHDRDLLDALQAIGAEKFTGDVWRIARQGRDPLQGSSASGRWSPAAAFEVLYTSRTQEGAYAEIGHRLALEPVWPSKVVHELHHLSINAGLVLHLPDLPALQALGVNTSRYQGYDYTVSQAIAAAAWFLGHDALLVPNARHDCLNLVVLRDHFDLAGIRLMASEPVVWQGWR